MGGCVRVPTHLAQPIAQVVAEHEVDPLQLHLIQVLLQLLRLIQLADAIHLPARAAAYTRSTKKGAPHHHIVEHAPARL